MTDLEHATRLVDLYDASCAAARYAQRNNLPQADALARIRDEIGDMMPTEPAIVGLARGSY